MPIESLWLLLPGIALILLGAFYLRKGFMPTVEPYRKNEKREGNSAAAREKTASLAAGAAFLIAGLILILFFTTVPSMIP
ncbi:hypothetical protein [Saccharibacillus deserti]|uniref:hypothetical protein n=1 Tax=Saccharibacillus deserti TaxID=1634444 RepID=UPI001554D003|nr:hypothetical protein [Saccharibacillus deserti]